MDSRDVTIHLDQESREINLLDPGHGLDRGERVRMNLKFELFGL